MSTDYAPDTLRRPHEWERHALCRRGDVDPDAWMEDRTDTAVGRLAASWCDHCPVQRRCLAEAMKEEAGLSRKSRYGIRGGLSAVERWRLDPARKGAARGVAA